MLGSTFRIGEHLPVHRIVQGGMGIRISLSGLASAVANCGGVGVISATGIGAFESDFRTNPIQATIRALEKEILSARERSSGIIGVNVMCVLSNFSEIVHTAISKRIDVIFAGAGLPLDLPKYLTNNTSTALVPIISSAKAASIIIRRWMKRFNRKPDALVLEGPMAGGHLGFKTKDINDASFSLERLLNEVLKVTKDMNIPVIAGGGVHSGDDLRRLIGLGASAVQLGSRFVATEECDASKSFKQSYTNCSKDDLRIIESPVGLPGRAITNCFLDDVENGLKKPYTCPYHCIKTCKYKNSPYCIADALLNAQVGDLDNGFAFAGGNAYKIKEISTVKKVINELVNH